MIALLKAGIGIGLLWWLAQQTNGGKAAIAAVKKCPSGTVSGPWFSCVPNCDAGKGEFPVVSDGSMFGIPAGTTYCARHGGVTDEAGNAFGSGNFDPSVGANGAVDSLPGEWSDGPITSPHDPRLG